ncbi:MAG: SAM-dependent methyltransferase [Holophagales bacterium]|nr:MAG: SAM-dependent methyltransferase [Holophagales bacterium]
MGTVAERLRDRIREQGAIPFSAFMEEALYGEDGYYRRADFPVGAGGDFITAPSLSPLFGGCTARLLERLAGKMLGPMEMLEVGYGDATHLRQVASQAIGARLCGVDRNGRGAPEPIATWRDLAPIAPGSVRGLVFSYELFDALPIRRVVGSAEGPRELFVTLADDGSFAYREAALASPGPGDELRDVVARLLPGQVADVSPGWAPLYRELARRLGAGLVVTCDYGFAEGRLYDARARPHGTLAAYRRHRVHRDALAEPGMQDLTAHVDFDLLRAVGEAEGLETIAVTRLANWLVACGLFRDLDDAEPRARAEAMALLDLEGPGVETLVLVQSRGLGRADVAALFDVPLLAAR